MYFYVFRQRLTHQRNTYIGRAGEYVEPKKMKNELNSEYRIHTFTLNTDIFWVYKQFSYA